MKAAYYRNSGSVKEIVVGDVPLPKAVAGEIIVRVCGSSVNPIDVKLRENPVSLSKRPLPKVLGSDFCGYVVDISMCEDSYLSCGDLVYGMMPLLNSNDGSCAEYLKIKESDVALAPCGPPNFTEAEIASLPLTALTVLQAFEPFIASCAQEQELKTHSAASNTAKSSTASASMDECESKTGREARAIGVAVTASSIAAAGDYHLHGSGKHERELYHFKQQLEKQKDQKSDTASDMSADISSHRPFSHAPLLSVHPYTSQEPDYEKLYNTSGKTVLIQGGAGGLGCVAIQYAKHFLGMHVITTCSTDKSRRFCLKLGADVVIDYTEQNFLEENPNLRNVDVVFDPFSYLYRDRTLKSTLPVLKSGGFYLDIASSPHSRSEAAELNMLDPLQLAVPEASFEYIINRGFNWVQNKLRNMIWGVFHSISDSCRGEDVDFIDDASTHAEHSPELQAASQKYASSGLRYTLTYVRPSRRLLRKIARLVQAGVILPVLRKENIFPFTTEGVRLAHDRVQKGHTRGKVVIAVEPSAGCRGAQTTLGRP